MAIRGQRNRISSFVRPPLPKEIYIEMLRKHGEAYTDFLHEIIRSFYRTGSINKSVQRAHEWSEAQFNK